MKSSQQKIQIQTHIKIKHIHKVHHIKLIKIVKLKINQSQRKVKIMIVKHGSNIIKISGNLTKHMDSKMIILNFNKMVSKWMKNSSNSFRRHLTHF